MKIALFGANGRTGVFVVEEALARGHSVVAGVRGQHGFQDKQNLTIKNVDILNPQTVEAALTGCDAVVSVVGHVRKSPAFVQRDGITNLVDAMEKAGIRRIISLTGTGVRTDGDSIPFYDYILNAGISLIDPKRVNDGKEHFDVLKTSSTDWTVIRVLKLQNTSPKPFSLTKHGPTKLYVSRKDVAKAIIDVLEQGTFVHEAPILS